MSRTRRICVLVLSIIAGSGVGSSASAATFFADLTLVLEVTGSPGAGIEVIGGAPAVLPFCNKAAVGNAEVNCKDPTSALLASALTSTAGPVSGLTGFRFGSAIARSEGISDELRVFNPGETAALFDVSLFFNGILRTSADEFETAFASYEFFVERNGVPLAPFTKSNGVRCNACDTNDLTDMPLLIIAMDVVPAGGTVSYRVNSFVAGSARSALSEPAPLLLYGLGSLGLLCYTRGRNYGNWRTAPNSHDAE